jgi:hypothetical protein
MFEDEFEDYAPFGFSCEDEAEKMGPLLRDGLVIQTGPEEYKLAEPAKWLN